MPTSAPSSPFRAALLWLLAALLMAATVIYQRRTGPTHPLRGTVSIQQKTIAYRLIRSEETVREARVALPDPGVPGTLVWRRFPTQEPWTRQSMVHETKDGKAELAGYLPKQPPAGKVEYAVELGASGSAQRIPAGDPIVLRYKGPVSTALLISHVSMMFLAVFIGLRAGLGALFGTTAPRRLMWITLGCLTLGGLILGPFVQKATFGAYWTGFPWGYDLTDNKTLLMWLAWALAALVAGLRPQARDGRGRLAVLAATLAMAVVYLIPHSMRGSQLDYSKVKAGTNATDAVVTGR
ncbi:hypothetical protein [Geothrix sp. PMB-07]|uniref:hypothetical protein n=1 Tax=Geothrix sp. PMB-07 TaxID=3068640 RepID=UPI0027421A8E|nr:hypothetical protein [Geothrix sp. PMB-07]WLT31035.1 hypothetical protein Q9293_15055 [Geothrix sp. PMB-07]